ncbi:hypothetical protein EJ03DRAFT_73356 [Teratosphaeria nubilosa]|uniref:Uncharacterized protein n=1 Tax=Teratosphaeria nubilosa TaxID=161662 RepID=A0A6G1LM85_9PEZI|nr:hypothetical protein EJ03DRAFT_73356 [Teratosphaeria nubilosa]
MLVLPHCDGLGLKARGEGSAMCIVRFVEMIPFFLFYLELAAFMISVSECGFWRHRLATYHPSRADAVGNHKTNTAGTLACDLKEQ